MSEGAVSPKKGLFQSLSKRVSGYRNKRKGDQHPSSPGSQVSESASESQSKQLVDPLAPCKLYLICNMPLCPELTVVQQIAGSVDVEVDLLEVQVSGKSARSARRLTSRQGLMHLKSAPAGALQAAAELAVAEHMSGSSSPYAMDSADSSTPLSSGTPSSARARWNRSQSHMDIPKHGSAAISLDTAAVNLDSAASSSSSGQLVPLATGHSSGKQTLPPYLLSPAAAPEVQQVPLETTAQQQVASPGAQMLRRMSRKISGNKLILSSADSMEAKNGEIMLPSEATPFATNRVPFDDLEICFSGKSARMSRGARRPDVHTIAAH